MTVMVTLLVLSNFMFWCAVGAPVAKQFDVEEVAKGNYLPNDPMAYVNFYRARRPQRPGWNPSGWFPIEINVPDTIGSITNGITTTTSQISQAIAQWIQRLPFINNQHRPRPLKYLIMVPVEHSGEKGDHQEESAHIFDPFEEFSPYP